jgi:hypothetical protein
MTTFRITEQEARVVERSYDVEAASDEEAQDRFESLEGDARSELLVHTETIRVNVEIVGVEPI